MAPPGATQVELSGFDSIGGDVANDAYVVAIEAEDILPSQLEWVFRDGLGNVIAQGSNITP